ncbi:hypothetical protein MNBD_PLANCTO02-1524 [hydrothermal vent metagenome]|uniref:Glycosyltransferase subfamily 4-like N-terminal domain-containing protein n=1 Tax=hydrothermal vent metagenome TaxID=652676 RepID=A0A3B1E863_9ZZZZ
MEHSKQLLFICCVLPQSLEKSAHMLTLREMVTLGWNVTVLTVQQQSGVTEVVNEEWQGVRLLRVPCQSCITLKSQSRLKRLLSIQSFPDRYASGIDKLLAHALQLHVEQSFDIVLSLYHPISSHSVAQKFSHQTDCPWIALTKDYYSWPKSLVQSWRKKIVNPIKRRFEKKLYQDAHAILSTNNQMSDYLQQLAPHLSVDTLRHCYDETNNQNKKEQLKKEHKQFRLVSIGLTTKEDAKYLLHLFSIVKELSEEGFVNAEQLRLRFIGHRGKIVRQCAEQTGCQSFVDILPPVSHAKAMSELANATCLFLRQFDWGSRRRLADYIGARKPILAYPEYSEIMSNDVLKQYGAAEIASDQTGLKKIVLKFYQQYFSEGELSLPLNEELVNSYTSSSRAKELDRFIGNIIKLKITQKQKSVSATKEPVDAS